METNRLDNIVSNYGCPNIIKIDVEGSEYDVLRGLGDICKDNLRLIYCEIHPSKLDEGVDFEIIKNYLTSRGFDVERINERDRDFTIKATREV